MAAPKKRRIPINIDMTPMVDIAFLLLIFFMATTVFKKPEEVAVRPPLSHSTFTLPETGMVVITVPKDNYIMMTLEIAALDYELGLSEQEGRKIVHKRFQPEELPPIIKRLILRQIVDRVVIKADREAEYGVIESVMETLQKENLNILNFVTDLEEEVRVEGAFVGSEKKEGASLPTSNSAPADGNLASKE
ncbi:biopolymer transporter ExbD [bacterium]|nr:biopolymer transporter ExbD [bacterium]